MRGADETGGLILDATKAQLAEHRGGGTMTVAIMPARGEVTQLSQVGEWGLDRHEVVHILMHPRPMLPGRYTSSHADENRSLSMPT